MLYQDQIDSNKDFTYEVDATEWYTEQTTHNVTRCLNCTNANCHENCSYGDGQDKQQCVAFKNEVCTICPGKCHYTLHKN